MLNACYTCGGPTEGYKCTQCNQEMFELDAKHACGREQCRPKCSSCGEADNKCFCGGTEDDETRS